MRTPSPNTRRYVRSLSLFLFFNSNTGETYNFLVSFENQDPEAFEKAALAADAPAPVAPKPKAAKAALAVDVEDDDFQTVGNKGKTIAISSEGIYKALAQVLEARGRKVCPFFFTRL